MSILQYQNDLKRKNRYYDTISASLQLILQRCGPKTDWYEGMKALSTGGACKSAIFSNCCAYGYYADYTEHRDGGFSENTENFSAIRDLMNNFE